MDVTKDHAPTGWLPDAKVLRGLLTPEECQVALTAAQEKGYPATRIMPNGELAVDVNFRNCDTSHYFPGDPIYEMIAKRVLERLSEFNEHYEFDLFEDPHEMIPVININRYREGGGKIGRHTDVGGYRNTENCKLSISILLNTDYGGGDFFVFGGYEHYPMTHPKPGDCITFASFMVHCVTPVMKGDRYSAVIWLRGPRFR